MIPRIYHPKPLNVGDIITLTPKASQHCLKVLRLKEGDWIQLFCGDENLYPAQLTQTKGQGMARIQSKTPHSVESPLSIHLGQGLARHDRMDWIIQKAVECGVTTITPLITEKSIIKLKNDRVAHKVSHWQEIIVSACEQSGRTCIPKLLDPTPLKDWVDSAFEGESIVFAPNAKNPLKPRVLSHPTLRLLLGPESGLSDKELRWAYEKGFLAHHLGPRILRTETATIAALSTVQVCFGDM